MRYAYLGPEGSFSQAALQLLSSPGPDRHIPFTSVDKALEALRNNELDGALVPIENSVEGAVPATMDALANGTELQIQRESVLPVKFVLAARHGTELANVARISTHPHAWAQCRQSVTELLPGVEFIPAASTSGAAAELADTGQPVHFDAFVGSELAARQYELEILAHDVADRPGAETRFVLVTLPGTLPLATGADKTSLILPLPEDRPGALLELLEQFATRGVNLSRIESRPTGKSLGSYFFFIDAEGHLADARVSESLRGLHRISPGLRFLGSYPRADAVPTKVTPATSNEDFEAAEQWVSGLLRGR